MKSLFMSSRSVNHLAHQRATFFPRTTMGGSCQCANTTRIRGEIMSSSPDVMTVVPGFFVNADIRQPVTYKTYPREGAEITVPPPDKKTTN